MRLFRGHCHFMQCHPCISSHSRDSIEARYIIFISRNLTPISYRIRFFSFFFLLVLLWFTIYLKEEKKRTQEKPFHSINKTLRAEPRVRICCEWFTCLHWSGRRQSINYPHVTNKIYSTKMRTREWDSFIISKEPWIECDVGSMSGHLASCIIGFYV